MTERKETVQKHAIIFVIFDGQKIQLEERIETGDKYFGYTLIPGGKLEPGETLEMALKREVGEEYGVNVLEAEELGAIHSVGKGGIQKFKHVFLVSK
jgi:8-oxo-dGTP pyrophosphatase MutT (NUDIX family)